jgi:MoaA/NifB/PqqE/SkfB family radical SAM enzyme
VNMRILVMEPHSRCNCRCVMCDIWKRTDAREIGERELARHIDDIVLLGVQRIVFTGGEPLMHSDLFRLAAPLRARGMKTTLLSTGLLLARDAGRIVESIGEIHDEIRRVPGAFDRLAEGVDAIHHLSPNYPVSARCTVQARNAGRLRAAVVAARSLGLESISFLAADLDSTAFDRPVSWPDSRKAGIAPELTALEDEIEGLIAEYPGDGFILEPPAKLRRIVAHFRAHYGMEPYVAPRCNAPWVSAVWEASGDIRPCFFHPPIGNTANRTFAQIVNGGAAVAFRESLKVAENPVCQRCVCSLYL